MKMITFMGMVLLAGLSAFAQYSLDSSNIFQVNDSIATTVITVDSIEPGPSGANQSWDFTSAITSGNSEAMTLNFLDPSTAPSSGSFPGATVVEEQITPNGTSYFYWKVSGSELSLTGVLAEGIEVPYSDFAKLIDLPASFGGQTIDEFASTFSSNGATANRTGTTDTTADAWGSITLPQGTFTNSLRFYTQQTVEDSISISGQNLTSRVETSTWSWWVPESRYPVLAIAVSDSVVITGKTRKRSVKTSLTYVTDATPDGAPVDTTRWMPHVTAVGRGFETKILTRNNGTSSDTVTLTAYGSNGDSLGTETLNLSAGQLNVTNSESMFPGSDVSHISIEGCSDCNVSAGYKSTASENAATAHAHQTKNPNTSFFVYPGESLVFDGMAIVNTGSGNATITGTQIDGSGTELASKTLVENLAPGAKHVALLSTEFDLLENSVIRIDSTQPSESVFLRGSWPGAEPSLLYLNDPVGNRPSQRWMPHVTKSGRGFESHVIAKNHGSSAANLTLQPYDSLGNALGSVTINLSANEQKTTESSVLFSGEDVSHFSISGSSNCSLSVGYISTSGNDAATAHFHETGSSGTSMLIYLGERDLVFDGMAVINLGDSAATITGTLLDENNNSVESKTLTSDLLPNSKYIAVLSSEFSDIGNGILKIESNQDLAVVFLRGTWPGADPAFLYTNPPILE